MIVARWSLPEEMLAARSRIAELEARLAAVMAIHKPFGVYDECGHDHQSGEDGTFEVPDVGTVCAAGPLYRVCTACHTVDGVLTEDADEGCFPCPTRKAAEKP